ncbi:YceD family protein [Alloscardovia macacae]|uniref:DNA-binding protein n=1 Tax=Alloscardovia macacae TaxID=1160091 RepID=A0A261F7Y4_9BIFI|nr:YceD family protein [Alloscardovia macacae]OZG54986.1 DNA-binding protein [Alloscardovia macacae]
MAREHETPWSISISQLSLKAGQTQTIDNEVMPAPSGIGDDLVGIPEGTDVTVSGMLESLSDGILFTGTISAPFDSECARCLEPIHETLTASPVTFFTYESEVGSGSGSKSGAGANEEVDILAEQDETEDTYPLNPQSIYLNMEALIRDSLAQALPLQPLDREDCLGLCPQCGLNLNENPDHKHEVVNIQWAALEGLKAQLEAEAGTSGSGADGDGTNGADGANDDGTDGADAQK